jgi:hypothetical protein
MIYNNMIILINRKKQIYLHQNRIKEIDRNKIMIIFKIYLL